MPIMAFKDAIDGQVEIGLGTLAHRLRRQGFRVYERVFSRAVVAKWNAEDAPEAVEKLPVHYNIGHIMAAEGDTVSPDGKYVVAMNKMSIDRFNSVGPLYPQNFQLIDTAGETMKRPGRCTHRHRRAALLADDQGRQDSTPSRSTRRARTSTPAARTPTPSRPGRSASSARTTACTCT
jgi:nitrous oxide reductase